jgi:hypothetical protein
MLLSRNTLGKLGLPEAKVSYDLRLIMCADCTAKPLI